MSYHSRKITSHKDPDVKLGQQIYLRSLAHRRGFRDDQLGIFDVDIWIEIFKEMGETARTLTKA